jgi:hypothetical protein
MLYVGVQVVVPMLEVDRTIVDFVDSEVDGRAEVVGEAALVASTQT